MHAALQSFQRRAVVARFLGVAVIALVVAIIFAELGWVWHVRGPWVWASLALAALVASVFNAMVHRPDHVTVARRVDARAHLQDLVVSALSCEGDGMASLVRSRALVTLQDVARRDVYPVEWPRHWRPWLLGAMAVQVIVLGIAWQAPAARARETSAMSQTPAGAGAASAAKTPQRSEATPPKPAADTPASLTTAVHPPSTGGVARQGDAPDAATAAALPANGEARARLAIARAAEDLRSGRVPIARRTIVERYFAALSSQRSAERKPPR